MKYVNKFCFSMRVFQAVWFAALVAAAAGRVVTRGKVATPTQFGRIHVHLSVEMFGVNSTELEALSNLVVMATATSSPRVKEMAHKLEQRVKHETRGLREEAEELTGLLFRNTTTEDGVVRVERAAVALAIAAGLGIGLGVAAVSFATANRVELESLKADLAATNERQERLFATVAANNEKLNADLALLNATIIDLAETVDEQQSIRLVADCTTRMREFTLRQKGRQRELTRGVYAALAGRLDPALVPIAHLQHGLATVEEFGRSKGLKVVEMEVLESAFSMPLTVFTNETGISLVIEVPMIPEALEPLDLLQVSHPSLILDNTTTLEIDFSSGLILTDPQRRYQREVTAAELSLCPQFKGFRFCDFTELKRQPETCLASYVVHDVERIKKLCSKYFRHTDFDISPVDGGVVVRSREDLLIRRECPHNDSLQAVFRTGENGEVHVALPAGCYLDTLRLAYFGSEAAIDVYETVEPDLVVEDLLEGITIEETLAAVRAIARLKNLTTLHVPVRELTEFVSSHREEASATGRFWLATGLGGTGLVLACIALSVVAGRLMVVWWRLERRV